MTDKRFGQSKSVRNQGRLVHHCTYGQCSEFLETLSHELRTPLNAILGWADLFSGAPLEADEYQLGGAAIARNARAQACMIDKLLSIPS